MLRVLTPEEVQEDEQLCWDALSAGSIFSARSEDSEDRMFLSIKKTADQIDVIELHPENIKRIVDSQCCQHDSYTSDEIKVWELHDPDSQGRKNEAYETLHPVPEWMCSPVAPVSKKRAVREKFIREIKHIKIKFRKFPLRRRK